MSVTARTGLDATDPSSPSTQDMSQWSIFGKVEPIDVTDDQPGVAFLTVIAKEDNALVTTFGTGWWVAKVRLSRWRIWAILQRPVVTECTLKRLQEPRMNDGKIRHPARRFRMRTGERD